MHVNQSKELGQSVQMLWNHHCMRKWQSRLDKTLQLMVQPAAASRQTVALAVLQRQRRELQRPMPMDNACLLSLLCSLLSLACPIYRSGSVL
mmetsp:Transcript_44435/g.95415  ORF Transcript_44435/g.95415 Transcript_44435/m.95415 type:complete len:92 (-) Transcript_44435:46-321(-)